LFVGQLLERDAAGAGAGIVEQQIDATVGLFDPVKEGGDRRRIAYRAAPSIADLIGKAPIKTLAIAFVAGEGRDRQRPAEQPQTTIRPDN